MIDDTYRLPFGKHKHKPLKDVPDDYLERFYHSNISGANSYELHELLNYIETRLNILVKDRKELDKSIDLVLNMCPKEVFITESDAKYRLKHINSFGKTNNKKLPQRAYQCEKCGFWHLTSKDDTGYRFRTELNKSEPIVLVKKDKTNSGGVGYRTKHVDAWTKLMENGEE